MKGFGGEIITCPIEATMPSALATSSCSYITLRRIDILASINLDKSGIPDSRSTRIKQDNTNPLYYKIFYTGLTKIYKGQVSEGVSKLQESY
jgi:hypothetical protein